MMRSVAGPCALTLGFVLLSWGSMPAAAASPAAAEFGVICEQLSRGQNAYFSRQLLDELRSRLARGPADPRDETSARGLLGRELLRQGETGAAIEELTVAFARARELEPEGGSLLTTVHWLLALAHLQLAEDQNCIGHRSADSCILPIRGSGLHAERQASRRAGDLLAEYVEGHPKNVQAVWLLNVARQLAGDEDAVPAPLRLPPLPMEPFPRWRDVAPELGVAAVDLAGGAVMDDFDGDGLLDLITSTWDPCDHLKAYRNDGRGGFAEASAAWGLDEQLGGLNLIHGDYDNDGDLDLLVLRGAWLLGAGTIRNSLLRNEVTAGSGFRDTTVLAGLARPAYPTQTAAWGDYDGDGDLDLYVGNEYTKRGDYPSQLFRNRGDGTFAEVAAAAGVANRRYAKGVAWGDYDNDGDLDLYVSNFGPNRLYRNRGDGTFADLAPELGLTRPDRESFATWFFDYDNDGDLDLFVADYRQQTAEVGASYFGARFDEGQPLLYRNDGRGGFTEASRSVGLERPLMPMGANYGDLDNDGWLDVYLGTGEPDLASLMPNVMYRNAGGRLVDVSFSGGFAHLQKGHGVAFGDLDNDGDQDLLHQLGGFYPADSFGNALFLNPGPAASWVTLRLVGRQANRFGVGARLELDVGEGEGRRTLYRLVGSGGSFGSSSLQLEIGLGQAVDRVSEIRVRWPGGDGVQRFRDVEARRIYRLIEGEERLEPVELPVLSLGGAGRPSAASR